MVASLVREKNCSDALIGVGQHPAGWVDFKPMGFNEYHDSMLNGLQEFQRVVQGSVRTVVRSVHENPLGNRISDCPPTDWRNPEVIRVYNELLKSICDQLSIDFVDTAEIISPMWDTAQDWCHYNNHVGLTEAIFFGHMLGFITANFSTVREYIYIPEGPIIY